MVSGCYETPWKLAQPVQLVTQEGRREKSREFRRHAQTGKPPPREGERSKGETR
jgi:hypothetical protein